MRAPLLIALASLIPLACTVTETTVVHSHPDASDEDGSEPSPDDDAGQTTTDAGTSDSPSAKDVAVDMNVPGYPAVHPPLPLETYQGGPLLLHPKIVTISFAGDDTTLIGRFEQFGDTITSTPWWTAVTDGYCLTGGSQCIGVGSGGGHVRLTTAATSFYTDNDIQAFIQARVADGTFPAPTADTLYTLYFPSGVSIELMGTRSCVSGGFGGYHNSTTVTPPAGGSMEIAYAVIPRCEPDPQSGLSLEQETTISTSHEFIEAATDSHPLNTPSYTITDEAWSVLGGEVGDVCVDLGQGGDDQYTESGFVVQRTWSNKAAQASHDPCVPAPAGLPYFNVAPESNRIAVTVGNTAKVKVTGFSDYPLAPWTIKTLELDQALGLGSNVLSLSLDKPSLANGDTATLSVTLNSNPSQGAAIFAIISQSGTHAHFWFVEVVPQ
jgi:hypothetical protein